MDTKDVTFAADSISRRMDSHAADVLRSAANYLVKIGKADAAADLLQLITALDYRSLSR